MLMESHKRHWREEVQRGGPSALGVIEVREWWSVKIKEKH